MNEYQINELRWLSCSSIRWLISLGVMSSIHQKNGGNDNIIHRDHCKSKLDHSLERFYTVKYSSKDDYANTASLCLYVLLPIILS